MTSRTSVFTAVALIGGSSAKMKWQTTQISAPCVYPVLTIAFKKFLHLYANTRSFWVFSRLFSLWKIRDWASIREEFASPSHGIEGTIPRIFLEISNLSPDFSADLRPSTCFLQP